MMRKRKIFAIDLLLKVVSTNSELELLKDNVLRIRHIFYDLNTTLNFQQLKTIDCSIE